MDMNLGKLLEMVRDREAKSQTWLDGWTITITCTEMAAIILPGRLFRLEICQTIFMFIWPLVVEKAMAPHSSAWEIPWIEEPGRLQSMGSLRVGHNWATSLSLFTFIHWRRKWQPTPMFLPWESRGWGSLVGCCLWCRTESDTTEAT